MPSPSILQPEELIGTETDGSMRLDMTGSCAVDARLRRQERAVMPFVEIAILNGEFDC